MVAGNSETFTYTARESLSGATGPYGTLAYTYDGVGNRLTSTLGTATDTYIYPLTSNRLSTINLATGGTRGFTYDASGNVTAEARPGGTYAYSYNAAGRMSEFRINVVLQASYKYDAMGRQAIRTLSSPTAVTIHSVFGSQGRRIAEYNETSGALIREYVWNGWDPIAVIEGGVISFVRVDHIGRPVFATNATGVRVWTATYTPIGGVHTSTGAPSTARFPGQWFQSESGLHQNWMRDYDPTTGRYLQADPLGLVDGASVYGYVRQSPMMLVDPTGEFGIPGAIAGAIIGGIAGGMATDGCWVGIVAGAASGALAGGIGYALTARGAVWVSAGTSAASQTVANWLSCYCEGVPHKSTFELWGSWQFWGGVAGAGAGGGVGSGVSGFAGSGASRWIYGPAPYFGKYGPRAHAVESAVGETIGGVIAGGTEYGGSVIGSAIDGGN